jgi:hypothetical protein
MAATEEMREGYTSVSEGVDGRGGGTKPTPDCVKIRLIE